MERHTINASSIKPGFIVFPREGGEYVVDEVIIADDRAICTMHAPNGAIAMGVYHVSQAVTVSR